MATQAKSGAKRKREMHVRLDTTVTSWLKRNKLPNGTDLVLERTRDGRRVRGDTIIHRHQLPSSADNDDKLSEALRALQTVLITDIEARHQRLRLYRPDGSPAPGNTLMRTLRQLPGLPTDEAKKQAEHEEIEVDNLATSLSDDLDRVEDMASSPEVLLRAYIRALRAKFTAEQMIVAVKRERA